MSLPGDFPGNSSLGCRSLQPRWKVKVSREFDPGPDFLPRVYVDVICHNLHSCFEQLQTTFCLSSRQIVARLLRFTRRQHSPNYKSTHSILLEKITFCCHHLVTSQEFPPWAGGPSNPVQCPKPPGDLTLGRASSQEFMSIWYVTIRTHVLSNYRLHSAYLLDKSGRGSATLY